MWSETEVVKYSSHYQVSILSPYVILHVSLIFQFLLQPRVRTFESFEIFTEACPRIPSVLGVMLRRSRCGSSRVALVRRVSRSVKITTEIFLAFCRSLGPLKVLMIEPEMFLQNSENRLLCGTVSRFRRVESLSTFRIRGLTLSYYFVQAVSVIGSARSVPIHDGPQKLTLWRRN